MKTIAPFVIAVFVILAIAVPAEAQPYRGYDPRVEQIIGAISGDYRGSYQRYDPYYRRGYDRRYDYRYDSRYRRGRTTVKDLAILSGVVGAVVIAGKIIDSRAGILIDQCHKEAYTPFDISPPAKKTNT